MWWQNGTKNKIVYLYKKEDATCDILSIVLTICSPI